MDWWKKSRRTQKSPIFGNTSSRGPIGYIKSVCWVSLNFKLKSFNRIFLKCLFPVHLWRKNSNLAAKTWHPVVFGRNSSWETAWLVSDWSRNSILTISTEKDECFWGTLRFLQTMPFYLSKCLFNTRHGSHFDTVFGRPLSRALIHLKLGIKNEDIKKFN